MELAHYHLLLNHWPIIGSFIGLGLFVIALATFSTDLTQVSLALFAFLALIAIPAYMSGNAAQEAIKELPNVSKATVDAHQGAALLAFTFIELTGAAAWLALWRFSRTVKNLWMSRPARRNLSAVLVLSIVTVGLMTVAGNTGGDIRHPEITGGPVPTSLVGAAGSKISNAVQYLVIEYRWSWPVLETLHFIGLILIVGTFGILNVRLLGFFKQLPVTPLLRFLPWGILGFGLNVVTGALFFIGMPPFYVRNPDFQVKLLTVMLAGGNLLLFFSTSAFQSWEKLGPGEDANSIAKFAAASSIVLWFALIVFGRYMPFFEAAP